MGERKELGIIKERYQLIRIIGAGGFGTTYLATDQMLGMNVAVKEYAGMDQKRKAQFLKEARNMAKFSGEAGIVNVRDFLEENDKVYLVMEFLDGKDLKTRIEEEGSVSFSKAMELMTPVMKTVRKLHAAGIIHRDISPENIRMLSNGTMKLLDFGSAMDVEVDEGKTMTVMVKPGYAPREQYLSKSHQGPWTDVYALCATIYKCITGQTPMDSLQRSFADELELPSRLGAAINSEKEAILLKGMAVDPKERIQSVEELMACLTGDDRKQDSEPIEVSKKNEAGAGKQTTGSKTQRKKAGKKKKSKTVISKMILAGLAAVMVIVVAVFMFSSDPYREKDDSYAKIEDKKVTGSMIKTIARDKKATKLSLYNCEVSDDILQQIAKMKYIEGVQVYQCTGFSSLEPLSEMKNLKKLSFQSDEPCNINEILRGAFAQVEELDISNRKVDSVYVISGDESFLDSFTGLKQLSLNLYTPDVVKKLDFLSNMPNLERLIMRGIDLSGDKSKPIENCKNLKYLVAEESGMTDVSWAASCANLEYLYLKANQISDISALQNCTLLNYIDFSQNQITDIGACASMEKLLHADFSENPLSDISPLQGIQVSDLYINQTQVTDLSGLQNNTNLLTLEAIENEITDVSALAGCERLQSLYLDKNRLSDIMPLSHLTNIQFLGVSNNQLTDLNACEAMIELGNLYASDNQITDISKLVNSSSLKVLNVANNQISDVSALDGRLTNLQSVDISNNHISSLEFLNGSNVSGVVANHNEITSLEPLVSSTKLTNLIIDHNQITSLAGMSGKTGLRVLLANDNAITDISSLSGSVSSLLYLDLGKNQIADISALSEISSAKAVLLDHNQITNISTLPDDVNYQALTIYGNAIQDISAIEKYPVNSTWSKIYLSNQEGISYAPLAASKYGSEMYIVDVPLDQQASLLAQIKQDRWGTGDPHFLTSDEADQQMTDYRSELLSTINEDQTMVMLNFANAINGLKESSGTK